MRTALGKLDRRILGEFDRVVGVDEVGRGALAGPVVVAGVAWRSIPDRPEIRDSKIMTVRQREPAAAWIREQCDSWVVVEVWPDVIDRLNILEATRLAMTVITRSLAGERTAVVLDAVQVDDDGLFIRSEVGADARYFCVASASIVAKVHRDRIMVELASRYHGWGWRRNKGYGTREHRSAMDVMGQSFLHRKSFHWHRVLP